MVSEMRAARRDDPILQVYPDEAADHGASVEYSAILVNPGLVPIVVTEARESIRTRLLETIEFAGRFVGFKPSDPEGSSIIIALPWAVPPNGFALWRRAA